MPAFFTTRLWSGVMFTYSDMVALLFVTVVNSMCCAGCSGSETDLDSAALESENFKKKPLLNTLASVIFLKMSEPLVPLGPAGPLGPRMPGRPGTPFAP